MTVETRRAEQGGLPKDISNVLPDEVKSIDKRIQDLYQNLFNLKARAESNGVNGSMAAIDIRNGEPPIVPSKIRELATLGGIFIDQNLLLISFYHCFESHLGDRVEINFVPTPGGSGTPKDAIRKIKLRIAGEFFHNPQLITDIAVFDDSERHLVGFDHLPSPERYDARVNEITKNIRTDSLTIALTNPRYTNFQLGFLEEVVGLLNTQVSASRPPSGRFRPK